MYNNLKPIPRHLLAAFLSNPETIKAFEKIIENAGILIPEQVDATLMVADSATAHIAAVEGMLDVLSSALGLLAMTPVVQPVIEQNQLMPVAVEHMANEFFALPLVDPEQVPYGAMYSNAHTIVAVAAINTAYEITADITTGLTYLFTFGGARYLQADRGGIYEVNWSVSLSSTNPNERLEAGIMIDGAAQASGLAHGDTQGASFYIEVSGSAILRLSALQQLSLYVMNHSSATNIEVDHISFTVKLIDRRVVT